VVSVTDPYARILDFLDRSRYFSFQLTPQLYSRGWVDPFRGPLLLRICSSAGNQTRTSGTVASNPGPLDHGGGQVLNCCFINVTVAEYVNRDTEKEGK
jgi:hypothetical protein